MSIKPLSVKKGHFMFSFFKFFFSHKKTHFYHLISAFHWVLCQIWGDRQGQIHPHSPQLALNPVTRVSERGRCFHAGCTICPVFTLLSICITDSGPEWHQHEATVIECCCFFARGGGLLTWNPSPRFCTLHAWFYKVCTDQACAHIHTHYLHIMSIFYL